MDFTKIPVFGFILKWLQGNDMDYGVPVTVLAAFLLYYSFSSSATLMGSSISFFFGLAPIWLPAMLITIFWDKWLTSVRFKYGLQSGRVTYRIRLPQEVLKSPEAMDYVLTQLWNQQNPDNYWHTYIDGKSPQSISLEIASIGGDIRFYISVDASKGKPMLLSSIYSQYPGIELIEEPVDYTYEIAADDPNWSFFSFHLNKKEARYAPLRTYVDMKLDTTPKKEEEKVDPMTIMLESMGNIGPHERVYYQMILRTFRKDNLQKGAMMLGEGPDWNEDAKKRVDELMMRDPKTKGPTNAGGADFDGAPRITSGERDTIDAYERNIAKYSFHVGIRYFYAAKQGHFSSAIFATMNRAFGPFDVIGRAQIGVRWRSDFNYNWFADPFGKKRERLKKQELTELKKRAYIQKGGADGMKFFTTEEIATMYHIPGRVAITPSLGRIPSTRSQPPANLPVGDLPTL